ncbi:hypothetical protein HMPREF9056_01742 [Actinomyces sp. oral taxon 170 str. F0386]|nr:hypothetical protein HMPREF9056_01742 [Actinomyces sp. oral taxon 170 str. F0386]
MYETPSFQGMWGTVVLRRERRDHIVIKRHHLDALFPAFSQTASAES